MIHHLSSFMVDLCLHFLRSRFRLVVIVVEEAVHNWKQILSRVR